MSETHDEKTLRLLLRAEFAEFKVGFFQELQAKLDAKADRLPFELLSKDVSDLKSSAERRRHLEGDVDVLERSVGALKTLVERGSHLESDVRQLKSWRVELDRARDIETARERGAWFVLKTGARLGGWFVAASIAAFDVLHGIFF